MQARINNGPSLPYLLDTGCDIPMMVEEWAARLSHLDFAASHFTLGTDRRKLLVAEHQTCLIVGADGPNSIEVTDVPMFVGQTRLGDIKAGHLAGIIGMPLLEVARLQFDFKGNKMYWLRPVSPISLGSAAPNVLRRSADAARYFLNLPTTPATSSQLLGGQTAIPGSLLLDTGASVTTLPNEMIAGLKPRAAFLRVWSDINGNHLYVKWLVTSLHLYGLDVRDAEVACDPLREPALGLDILSRFETAMDFPNRELWLRPQTSDQISTQRQRGFTGIELSQEGNKTRIAYVQPKSPAAVIGLITGNIVLTVDGKSINSLAAPLQGNLLDGNAGTRAILQIVDDSGKQRTFSVLRLAEDDPATFFPAGMRLSVQRFPQGYGVVIDAILCSSLAYSSGLQAGDVIRTANGGAPLLTKTYSDASAKLLPRIIALLQKPSAELTLTVRHLGAKTPQTVILSTVGPSATAPVTPARPSAAGP